MSFTSRFKRPHFYFVVVVNEHGYCEFLQLLYFIMLTVCDVQPTVLLIIKLVTFPPLVLLFLFHNSCLEPLHSAEVTHRPVLKLNINPRVTTSEFIS